LNEATRSVGRYRAIDLTLFAMILAFFETVVRTAAVRWFPAQPYTVSVTPAVTAIVMMRWGPWAGIHAFLGGLVYCLVSGGQTEHYGIYCLGSLLCLVCLYPLKRAGKEAVRADTFKSLLLALGVTVLMQTGRAAIALMLGHAPAEAAGFYTTDVITLLFTLIVIWIARRLDGVFEDQKHYLSRLKSERETQEGGVS